MIGAFSSLTTVPPRRRKPPLQLAAGSYQRDRESEACGRLFAQSCAGSSSVWDFEDACVPRFRLKRGRILCFAPEQRERVNTTESAESASITSSSLPLRVRTEKMATARPDLIGHLLDGESAVTTPRVLHGWEGPIDPWPCHCCDRMNDERVKRCKTCGRSAAYGEMSAKDASSEVSTYCSCYCATSTQYWFQYSTGQRQHVNITVLLCFVLASNGDPACFPRLILANTAGTYYAFRVDAA